LEIHHDSIVLGKVFAVALAVGLDVLAISLIKRKTIALPRRLHQQAVA
jgi:hypothetical protein